MTTDTISDITDATATCGGNVVYDGNTTVTARGVCWNSTGNPTLADAHTTDGSGTGSFTSILTGLAPSTTYYVRAYATNSMGTSYGSEVSFTTLAIPPGDAQPCPGHETVSDIDGNVYNTVKIGEQCWMKENLRTTHYADGVEIPAGSGASLTVAYRYAPNNNYNNVPSYGYLYNWPAVMHGVQSSDSNPSDVQGICPTGWHVPSDAEWTQLTDYVSSVPAYVCGNNTSSIAKALSATAGWNTSSSECTPGHNQSQNNAAGLGTLPTGYYSGDYHYFGVYACYWSATEESTPYSWKRDFHSDHVEVSRVYGDKANGFAVRCVLGDGYNLSAVTTDTVSNITASSATCGGNVTYDGNTTVTARGVCWSTSPNPTTADAHTSDGSGTGGFTSSITGLEPNTTYYVRAYATNSMGTSYGGTAIFTTEALSCTLTFEMHDSFGDGWNGNKILVHNHNTTQEVTLNGGSSGTVTIPVYSGALEMEWVNGSYKYECSVTITGPCLYYSITSAPSGSFLNDIINCEGGDSAIPSFTYWTENTCNSVIVHFENTSTNADTASWNIAGFITNEWNANYEFTESDTYPVTLQAGNSNCGLSMATTQNITIEIPEPITSYYDTAVCSNDLPIIWKGHTFTGAETYTATLQAANSCDSTVTLTLNVATSPALTHTPDTLVNADTPVTLWAYGTSNLVWTDANGDTLGIGETLTVTPTEATTYYVIGSNSSSNLVVNGDFEQGNTGFTSDYTYHTSNTGQGYGTYTIRDDAYNILGAGHYYGNGGSGQFMIVDGATTANAIVWSETVDAQPNTVYTFEMYARMLSTSNPTAQFLILVNGEQLGGVETMPNFYQWQKIKRYWNSGTNTTATITIIDQTNAGGNNDFGLDDILFAPATSCEVIEAVTVTTRPAGDALPCPGHETVTDYDGNVYNTVKIGEQCWMKENLRVTHYEDGVEIPEGNGDFSGAVARRYAPNDDEENVPTYGYLYNILAVTHNPNSWFSSTSNPSNVQGICPTGWHMPSSAEWIQLRDYVSSVPAYVCGTQSSSIAKALAATGGWDSYSSSCSVGNEQSTNNSTNFGALPAGSAGGFVSQFGASAIFWSCTYDWFFQINSVSGLINSGYTVSNRGFSVRCVLGDGYNLSVVTTDSVSSITATSATCGSNVTYDGNTNVTARGVCWSTSQNPTLADTHTEDGTGAGEFTSLITGLEPNTTYYVRAYATNSMGTSYGEEVSFTTLSIPPGDALPCPGHETVTDYDGNVYNTVKIGEQCWMKENLRVTHYEDGTEIPAGGSTSYYDAYRYSPGNNSDNVLTFGHLYNWPAVMHNMASSSTNPSNVQGVCPTGWHVPSISEWDQLNDYVKSIPAYLCNNSIAKALAATSSWESINNSCAPGNNQSANNITGFSALPATCYGSWCGPCNSSQWCSIGGEAIFWSSTSAPNSSPSAYSPAVTYNLDSLSRHSRISYNRHGYSVRCVLGEGCLTIHTDFSDTIYSGNSYTWNDSVYTESGDYTQAFTTVNGCDSVVTLHLTVTDCTPSCDAFAVRILGDTAGCATDSVTLHALVPGSVPPVAVGDILCTDGTTLKPAAFTASGKTAMGVVFHVDGTGLHGWAVHLNDQSTSITWGGYGTDIPTLPNYGSPREILTDTAGYANTAAIRAYGDAAAYPAAWAVDFDNGWYLPAAGQLRVLYGELPTLNASLQIVGGTQFPMSESWYYWSSTEYSSLYAWKLYYTGLLQPDNYLGKSNSYSVRSVRAL